MSFPLKNEGCLGKITRGSLAKLRRNQEKTLEPYVFLLENWSIFTRSEGVAGQNIGETNAKHWTCL